MSKLPIVSGAECIKALEKIGFSVYRQRSSHITMVCQEPANQVTVPNHKAILPKVHYGQLFDKLG